MILWGARVRSKGVPSAGIAIPETIEIGELLTDYSWGGLRSSGVPPTGGAMPEPAALEEAEDDLT